MRTTLRRIDCRRRCMAASLTLTSPKRSHRAVCCVSSTADPRSTPSSSRQPTLPRFQGSDAFSARPSGLCTNRVTLLVAAEITKRKRGLQHRADLQ
jgi:hypothetical protein